MTTFGGMTPGITVGILLIGTAAGMAGTISGMIPGFMAIPTIAMQAGMVGAIPITAGVAGMAGAILTMSIILPEDAMVGIPVPTDTMTVADIMDTTAAALRYVRDAALRV